MIHFYPPLSLEEYWQEAGRGGRGMEAENGEHCECVVLHKPSDYRVLQGFTNLASFEKVLSTFTCAAQGELCFDRRKVAPHGKLRQLLMRLHELKDVRGLKKIRVGGIWLERWKLRKPAGTVLRHIEDLIRDEGLKTKQTNRLKNNLRLFAARKGKIIRVEHGTEDSGPALEYYDTEFNWLTAPEIAALRMIDDEPDSSVPYSRFELMKDKLSRQEMRMVARRINAYCAGGRAKLDFVFNQFLKAKRGKAKSVILGYLALNKKPA